MPTVIVPNCRAKHAPYRRRCRVTADASGADQLLVRRSGTEPTGRRAVGDFGAELRARKRAEVVGHAGVDGDSGHAEDNRQPDDGEAVRQQVGEERGRPQASQRAPCLGVAYSLLNPWVEMLSETSTKRFTSVNSRAMVSTVP